MRLDTLLSGSAAGVIGALLAAGLAAGLSLCAPAPVDAAVSSQPTETVNLSVGRGQMISLSSPMSDLFVADDKVADVQVRSANQLYVFAKGPGETTVYATNRAGQVVYSANVRVGANITNVGAMLRLAMPEAAITATPMNGMMLLTGTVAAPTDIEEAQNLVQAFVGKEVTVLSRLRTATPMQVNLRVKIAEVNRSFAKQLGVNLLTRDTSGGFLFGIGQGNAGTIKTITDAIDPATGVKPGGTAYTFNNATGATTLGMAGHLLGLDVLSTIDLAENDGFVTMLAEPNLTSLSGETASFLAGGEIPIPIAQQLGTISIEYKQYGVSLAFTPTVLSDGRISLRVRPEVSELSNAGAVTLNGYTVPGITTRRAETTVELGSGQSFVIGGLLNNTHNNAINKAPFLGDLPILGALFRSNQFQRNETELMIIVTPYLVRPVSASQIALPTDGYKAPTDVERILGGQSFSGKTGAQRPGPVMAPPVTVQPGIPQQGADATPLPATRAAAAPPSPAGSAGSPGKTQAAAAPAPGFSFN